jgi:uncharacterized protein
MSVPGPLAETPLVDHHCHGVLATDLDRAGFERLLTEASVPGPAGTTFFDTQLGLAVRRWCAPVLGLPAYASPEDYLARRGALGATEVSERLLRGAGIGTYLIDTGYAEPGVLDVDRMAAAAGATAHEVVRLETVAEGLARQGIAARDFARAYADALAAATRHAVAVKSIVAYRHGLDFDPTRPSTLEIRAAAGRWLRAREAGGRVRLEDQLLLRWVLWAGVDTGLPVQIHTGYGDADLSLHRCDPLLLTDFIRAVQPTGSPLLLLHCYPYHRQAGYLAQVYPHVYLDVRPRAQPRRRARGRGPGGGAGAHAVPQDAVLDRRVRPRGALLLRRGAFSGRFHPYNRRVGAPGGVEPGGSGPRRSPDRRGERAAGLPPAHTDAGRAAMNTGVCRGCERHKPRTSCGRRSVAVTLRVMGGRPTPPVGA